MTKLLVHSQNTILAEEKYFLKEDQFVFQVDSDAEDVDFYMNEQVGQGLLHLKLQLADVVFIKVSLSQNYLEYFGIRLAYHIRLTNSLKQKRNIPIIFVAEESYQFLALTSDIPEILFTEGIYLMRDSPIGFIKMIKFFGEGKIKSLQKLDTFLDRIAIVPLSNYLSHHSIANEWSILRWAKVLGVSDDNLFLKEAKQNIDGMLYYKYLQTKYPIEKDPDKAKYKIHGKGKILYIDDEWDKGWDIVLREFFNISPELTKDFEIFNYKFKDQKEEVILKECKGKVANMDPDVVILDLRISDSDFEDYKKTSKLTGFKVLEAIKIINPGIRVIIFTASNKVWNFLELQNAGADCFVLKESPELSINKNHTREVIEKFAATIEEQLKYKFEKELVQKCLDIKKYLTGQHIHENTEYNRFIAALKKQIDIVYSSILLINLNKSITLDIAFLSCYNFLELFKKYYLRFNRRDYRYYLGFEEIDLIKYEFSGKELRNKGQFVAKTNFDSPSWFVTHAALSIDYFKISDLSSHQEVFNLWQLSDSRNAYIHSDKKGFNANELNLIIHVVLKVCEKIRE